MPFATDVFLQNLLRDLNTARDAEEIGLAVIIHLYQRFCTVFQVQEKIQPEQIEAFLQCSVKYVDCIKICIVNDPTLEQTQKENLKRIIRVVGDTSKLEGIRDSYYISLLTVRIFERIAEPDITQWFAKELLKNLNVALEGTNRKLRNAIAEKHQYNLCKLGDIICTCGDFDYQTTLMETIFRLCSEVQINKYARALFPKSIEFENVFISIKRNNFDVDRRIFLNMVNSKLKKVISVQCTKIYLGILDFRVMPPKDSEGNDLLLWLDFNRGANTITIFCNKDCLRTSPTTQNNQNGDDLEMITINIADISKVVRISFIASEPPHSRGTVLAFLMTKPFSVIHASSLEASKTTVLGVAILKSPELDILKKEALPDWFGKNFRHIKSSRKAMVRCSDTKREKLGRTLTSKQKVAAYKLLTTEILPKAKSGASMVSSTSDATSLKGKVLEHQDTEPTTLTEQVSKSIFSEGSSDVIVVSDEEADHVCQAKEKLAVKVRKTNKNSKKGVKTASKRLAPLEDQTAKIIETDANSESLALEQPSTVDVLVSGDICDNSNLEVPPSQVKPKSEGELKKRKNLQDETDEPPKKKDKVTEEQETGETVFNNSVYTVTKKAEKNKRKAPKLYNMKDRSYLEEITAKTTDSNKSFITSVIIKPFTEHVINKNSGIQKDNLNSFDNVEVDTVNATKIVQETKRVNELRESEKTINSLCTKKRNSYAELDFGDKVTETMWKPRSLNSNCSKKLFLTNDPALLPKGIDKRVKMWKPSLKEKVNRKSKEIPKGQEYSEKMSTHKSSPFPELDIEVERTEILKILSLNTQDAIVHSEQELQLQEVPIMTNNTSEKLDKASSVSQIISLSSKNTDQLEDKYPVSLIATTTTGLGPTEITSWCNSATIKNEIKKLGCEISQLKVMVAKVLEKVENLKGN